MADEAQGIRIHRFGGGTITIHGTVPGCVDAGAAEVPVSQLPQEYRGLCEKVRVTHQQAADWLLSDGFRYLSGGSSLDDIMGLFRWDATPQGHSFWSWITANLGKVPRIQGPVSGFSKVTAKMQAKYFFNGPGDSRPRYPLPGFDEQLKALGGGDSGQDSGRVRAVHGRDAFGDMHQTFLRSLGLAPEMFFGGRPVEQKPEEPQKPAGLTWDDVKGQDEAKRALREAVELPLKFPEIYKAYKKRPSKGALLYGPPGCGKTMLGKALASMVGGDEGGFQYIKGGEWLGPSVGHEEAMVRGAFDKARRYKARTGRPQVIFLDEADAMFPKRREAHGSSTGYDFMASFCAAFLTELDGLEDSGAFVILATNRPEVIDPAVLRDGRIDRKVRVARPTREVCGDILARGFAGVPMSEGLDPVATALDAVFDPKKCYCAIEQDDRNVRVNYHHGVSGAMMDGLVERSLANAIHRDIEAGNTAPSGLSAEDVVQAVESQWRSTWDLNNLDMIREVAGDAPVTNIKTFHGQKLHFHGNAAAPQELRVKVEHRMEEGGDE